jgi:pimeloyl-ACP methyl ester carboxylesterase
MIARADGLARSAVAASDGAQLSVLEGQDHMATRSAPDVVASQLIALLQT